jgi:RNA polymerase sigma-70 factor, ECF subfamily
VPADADAELLAPLRAGDEAAFCALVDRHAGAMLRTATAVTGSRAAAEEAVQDTWIAVLRHLHRFEGRSTFRTWVFRILVNRARTLATREGRTLPFSALSGSSPEEGPAVSPAQFDAAGAWAIPPASWAGLPEDRLLARESMDLLRAAIEALPPAQRTVLRLRDVEGWSAEEVCAALQLTPGNQRVLLHRARTGIRTRLDEYLA